MGQTAFAWDATSVRELEHNYLDERSSRWMYERLADADREPERAALLRHLAGYEERHAARWAALLTKLGRPVPRDTPFLEHRILTRVARMFGVGSVLGLLHKGEVDGIAKYRDQAERWKDPAAQEAFRDILPDEVAHEVDTFDAMRNVGASKGALRSAILGANDGLGSTLALVAGVAGATDSSTAILIAGFAGLVAGAVSMGASNYVSVRAEQEVTESQVRLSREALAVAPEAKRAQLEASYRAKGLSAEEASVVVERLSANPDTLLKSLLAEQQGITDAGQESARRLAAYTGLAFALAALVPIVPFLLLSALPGAVVSVAVTGVALFLTGILRALSTLHPFLRSGLQMVLVGLGAAAATFLVGLLVGGAVG